MSEDTSKVSVVPGEWSGDVAGVAAGAGLVAAVASTWIFTRAVARVDLTGTAQVVEDSSWVDGSFAQRATVPRWARGPSSRRRSRRPRPR